MVFQLITHNKWKNLNEGCILCQIFHNKYHKGQYLIIIFLIYSNWVWIDPYHVKILLIVDILEIPIYFISASLSPQSIFHEWLIQIYSNNMMSISLKWEKIINSIILHNLWDHFLDYVKGIASIMIFTPLYIIYWGYWI